MRPREGFLPAVPNPKAFAPPGGFRPGRHDPHPPDSPTSRCRGFSSATSRLCSTDPAGFKAAIDLFVDHYKNEKIDVIVGVEARGYMIGAPLAYALGTGFVPVRKPGKLPGKKFSEEYALEYGTSTLEIHEDAVGHGQRVLIVDDLLATGGTAAATGRLLKRLGADVVGYAFLIELAALDGRKAIPGHHVTSFITY